MPRQSALAACLAIVLLAAGLGEAAYAGMQDGDLMLNYRSPLVYAYIFNMPPALFNVSTFVPALTTFYATVDPSLTENQVMLLEWCAWDNGTYSILDPYRSYCRDGAKTGNVRTANHVLVSFHLYSGNGTAMGKAELNLPAPYDKPVAKEAVVQPMDPALYDPDTAKNTTDTGIIQEVYNNPVAFWAISGSLVSTVAVAFAVLAIVHCARGKRRRERNMEVLRRMMSTVLQPRASPPNPLPAEETGGGHRHRKSKKRGARQLGMEDPKDVRSRYDVAGPGDGEEYTSPTAVSGPGAVAASALPTSRASAYWPGTEYSTGGGAASSRVPRARDDSSALGNPREGVDTDAQEMEERYSAASYDGRESRP